MSSILFWRWKFAMIIIVAFSQVVFAHIILRSELGETSFELGPAFSMQFIVIEYLPIFFPVTWVSLLFNAFSFKISLFCLFPEENSLSSRQKAACGFSRFSCFADDLAFNRTNESPNCKDSHFGLGFSLLCFDEPPH